MQRTTIIDNNNNSHTFINDNFRPGMHGTCVVIIGFFKCGGGADLPKSLTSNLQDVYRDVNEYSTIGRSR